MIYETLCTIVVTKAHTSFIQFFGVVVMIVSGIQLIIYLTGIAILHQSYLKHYIYVNRTVNNAFKMVARILYYSYKHSIPEWRSAFTYWENKIPSRIDLGKQKYGGPFTNEQVEDFKTWYWLLLMIAALSAFHLSGDGYSLTYFTIQRIGCPSLIYLIMFVINPQHISLFVICLGIPLYKNCITEHFATILTKYAW